MAAPAAGFPPITAPNAAPAPAPMAPPLKVRCCWGVMCAQPVVADNSKMNITNHARFTD